MNKGNAGKYQRSGDDEASESLQRQAESALANKGSPIEIPKGPDRATSGNEQPSPNYQPSNRWMIWLTGLVFVVGGVQAAVSYYQWQTMKESLEITQRAYVVITDIKADFAAKRIQMTLENIGHVPAKEIDLEMRVERLGDYTFFPIDAYSTSEDTIAPTYKTVVYLPLKNLTQEAADLITTGKHEIQLACFLKYDDGFGKIEDIILNFRYVPPPNEGWYSLFVTREGEEREENHNRRWEYASPSPTASPSVP
jgi:hypothetical protein